jgi:hypothetical protein
MTIKENIKLVESDIYSILKNKVKERIEYLINLGYSENLARFFTDIDEDNTAVIWNDDKNSITAILCYTINDIDKGGVLINFSYAKDAVSLEQVYNYFEKKVKALRCVYINEHVPIKDHRRLTELENLSFEKKYYLLFKRVQNVTL